MENVSNTGVTSPSGSVLAERSRLADEGERAELERKLIAERMRAKEAALDLRELEMERKLEELQLARCCF